jgi:hypothetical protein
MWDNSLKGQHNKPNVPHSAAPQPHSIAHKTNALTHWLSHITNPPRLSLSFLWVGINSFCPNVIRLLGKRVSFEISIQTSNPKKKYKVPGDGFALVLVTQPKCLALLCSNLMSGSKTKCIVAECLWYQVNENRVLVSLAAPAAVNLTIRHDNYMCGRKMFETVCKQYVFPVCA